MVYQLNKSGTPKFEKIELGARVCKSIKDSYFKEIHWVKCNKEVTKMFTKLKVRARDMYKDITEPDRLIRLGMYSKDDMDDVFKENTGRVNIATEESEGCSNTTNSN